MVTFEELSKKYTDQFGEPPPVHDLGQWPSPEEARAMLEAALQRGSKITDDDYPPMEDPRTY